MNSKELLKIQTCEKLKGIDLLKLTDEYQNIAENTDIRKEELKRK